MDRRVIAINFAKRLLQIFFKIVTQRTKRRNVNCAKLLFEFAVGVFESELIEDTEKGGESFASAGGRDNEDIGAFSNSRPCAGLWRRRFVEPRFKPIQYRRFRKRRSHGREFSRREWKDAKSVVTLRREGNKWSAV